MRWTGKAEAGVEQNSVLSKLRFIETSFYRNFVFKAHAACPRGDPCLQD
jgi:hypothetical protein